MFRYLAVYEVKGRGTTTGDSRSVSKNESYIRETNIYG